MSSRLAVFSNVIPKGFFSMSELFPVFYEKHTNQNRDSRTFAKLRENSNGSNKTYFRVVYIRVHIIAKQL